MQKPSNLPQPGRHTKKASNPKVPEFYNLKPSGPSASTEGLHSSPALSVGKLDLAKS